MDLDFRQILLGSIDKGNTADHRFEGDALIIECTDCGLMPEPGSKECMKCIVDRISESGGADRVILRTGRDLEISGRSGLAIRKIASLKRSSCSYVRDRGRCKRCPAQRAKVMEMIWEDFLHPNYHGAKELLDDSPDNEECMRCVSSTKRSIVQIEADIEEIRRGLVRP